MRSRIGVIKISWWLPHTMPCHSKLKENSQISQKKERMTMTTMKKLTASNYKQLIFCIIEIVIDDHCTPSISQLIGCPWIPFEICSQKKAFHISLYSARTIHKYSAAIYLKWSKSFSNKTVSDIKWSKEIL